MNARNSAEQPSIIEQNVGQQDTYTTDGNVVQQDTTNENNFVEAFRQ